MGEGSRQKSITRSNLIFKMGFLQQSSKNFEIEEINNKENLNKLNYSLKKYARSLSGSEFLVPKSSVIDGWIAGDIEIADEEMPFLLSWLRAATPEIKAKYFSEQSETYKRLEIFLKANQPQPDQREIRSSPVRPQLIEIGGAVYGLVQAVNDARKRLSSERPNSDESIAERQVALDLLEFLDEKTQYLHKQFQSLVENDERKMENEISLAHDLGDEFRNWLLQNKPELVDAAMRLTPACAFISVLSMSGAAMTWATPVVLALCGGKRIVEILKGLKKVE